MDKQTVEAFKAHQTRQALRNAMRAAAEIAVMHPRVLPAPPFTANKLDLFTQRRLEQYARQRQATMELRAKKKKLPLPTAGIFSCENELGDQLRPRVLP